MKMILDFSNIIEHLKKLQDEFNNTQDATQRYAIMQAINYIGREQLPFSDFNMECYRKAMLRERGVSIF